MSRAAGQVAPPSPKRKLIISTIPRGPRHSLEVFSAMSTLSPLTCPSRSTCCDKDQRTCGALPAGRRYCVYQGGPAGWSHDKQDPFEVNVRPQAPYYFVGCRESLLALGGRCRRFVLAHELEHERQRSAGRLTSASFVALFGHERRANVAGWRAVHLAERAKWLQRLRWINAPAWIDCVVTAFFATLLAHAGTTLSWMLVCVVLGVGVVAIYCDYPIAYTDDVRIAEAISTALTWAASIVGALLLMMEVRLELRRRAWRKVRQGAARVGGLLAGVWRWMYTR